MASLILSAAVGLFLVAILATVFAVALRSTPALPTLDDSPDEKESEC